VHPCQPDSDATLYGTLWLSEQGGDLFVGVATEVGQLNRLLLSLGQAFKRLPHMGGDHEIPDLVLDVVAGLRRRSRLPLLADAPGALRAENVDCPTVGLGEQERAERPTRLVEALRSIPEPEKDLLNDLLSKSTIPQHSTGQSVDRTGMAPIDLGERLLVPAGNSEHKIRVARCLQVVSSHLRWSSERRPLRMIGHQRRVAGNSSGKDPTSVPPAKTTGPARRPVSDSTPRDPRRWPEPKEKFIQEMAEHRTQYATAKREARQMRAGRGLIIAATVLTGAVLLSACGSGSASTAPTTSKGPAKTSSTAPASTQVVIIKNFAFHPADFTIKPGGTITITNEDPVDHTFTAFPGSTPQGHFNTGDIAPNATVSITAPTTAGAYRYYCSIHPYMTGVMTVS